MKTRRAFLQGAKKRLSFAAPILALCCPGGCHGAHEFDTYLECYEHEIEEGASTSLAAEACDDYFAVTHTGEAACRADHAADVTAGVPQAAIDDHCMRLFPASDGGV